MSTADFPYDGTQGMVGAQYSWREWMKAPYLTGLRNAAEKWHLNIAKSSHHTPMVKVESINQAQEEINNHI